MAKFSSSNAIINMPDPKGIEVRIFERDQVTLDREIGKGKFGKVYLASIADTKLPPVAIKIFRKDLKKDVISQKEKESAYEELLKLAVIDHENVVKLYGMVQDDLPWLVFEFMKDGNLLEYVMRNEKIKEKTLIRFCRDICCGMAFLHSHQVLHKDLAARNILLNGKTAKIADLGLSSFLTHTDSGIYALNGKMFPFRHAAVECIVEQVYTFESDVWAFGILLFEIFTGGSTPYGKENKEPEVRRFIVDHITPLHLLEPSCSSKIYSIIKYVLNPVLQDRPTFQQLYHKFQKLLNGKPATEQSSDENVSAAFTTFHQIKANGLSSSITNLQSSPSTSSTTVNSPAQNVQEHLTVSQNYDKSSSTPDLLKSIGQHASKLLMNLPKNGNKSWLYNKNMSPPSDSNSLSVSSRSTPLHKGRRRHSLSVSHSEEVQLPLNSLQSTTESPSNHLDDSFYNEDEEPRRRANSSSRAMNNPLLEGFVKNRFARR